MSLRNPISMDGFDFLEFATTDPEKLSRQFESMGFLPVARHNTSPITIYQQNDIRFIMNLTKDSQASHYAKLHGTSICSMGFKVRDAATALQYVRLKGATPYQPLDENIVYDMPAIYGVGNMLIYFVDYKNGLASYTPPFSSMSAAAASSSNLVSLDHVSFNLYRGHMIKWADFYTRLFNFQEAIQVPAKKKITGFREKSMTSACGKIRLSLTESSDDKSQIEAFLNYFNGEGIRRISFETSEKSAESSLVWLDTMDQMKHESLTA